MHVNELRPLVPQGDMASQHKLLRAAHALGHADSSALLVACEAPGCPRSVTVADAFSLALVYRMPGRGVSAFQCRDEQHFGCSHDHAVQAMLACLRDHIEPAHRQYRAQQENAG